MLRLDKIKKMIKRIKLLLMLNNYKFQQLVHKMVNVDFLNGQWNAGAGIQDKTTGKPATLKICILRWRRSSTKYNAVTAYNVQEMFLQNARQWFEYY